MFSHVTQKFFLHEVHGNGITSVLEHFWNVHVNGRVFSKIEGGHPEMLTCKAYNLP